MDCSWSQATAFNFFLSQPPFFRTFLIYFLISLDFLLLCKVCSPSTFFFQFPLLLGHLPHLAPWLPLGISDPSLVPLPQAPRRPRGPPPGSALLERSSFLSALVPALWLPNNNVNNKHNLHVRFSIFHLIGAWLALLPLPSSTSSRLALKLDWTPSLPLPSIFGEWSSE